MMAKRFGRNRKRKLLEEIDALEQAVHIGRVMESGLRSKLRNVEEEHAEETKAARLARDTIRLDINSLVDPDEKQIRIMARFDNMSRHVPEMYSAYNISADEILRRSDIEKSAFLSVVGTEIAENALAQIMRHWRSR